MKSYRLGYRIYLLFAWYDLWVGIFVNVPKRHLYFFPVPCVGFLYCYGTARRRMEAQLTDEQDLAGE